MWKNLSFVKICTVICLLVGGCATAPEHGDRKKLTAEATDALKQMQTTDPSLTTLLTTSPGYAVFPKVSKGAAGVGGRTVGARFTKTATSRATPTSLRPPSVCKPARKNFARSSSSRHLRTWNVSRRASSHSRQISRQSR